VKQFLALPDWPNGAAAIDLGGGRVLGVIPTPGHEPSHITLYDQHERLLLTGDTPYPGLLVLDSGQTHRNSIGRFAAFIGASHPVKWLLGEC